MTKKLRVHTFFLGHWQLEQSSYCVSIYVLDKGIQNSLKRNIENSIIVLNEAHNIDGALREPGSGEFLGVELSQIATFLLLLMGLPYL